MRRTFKKYYFLFTFKIHQIEVFESTSDCFLINLLIMNGAFAYK